MQTAVINITRDTPEACGLIDRSLHDSIFLCTTCYRIRYDRKSLTASEPTQEAEPCSPPGGTDVRQRGLDIITAG